MDNKTDGSLKRTLTPMHVWAIAFGCVIGWGSFINPGKKFLTNSGVAGTAIAMVLGALVMIIIAFSYAYMVPKYPKAGGEFTFTKMCFGKTLAFICGWFLVVAYLTNVPMNSTAIGLIVDGLDGGADILKFGFHYTIAGFDIYMGEMLLASAILILFGYLNIIGVQKAAIVQTILSTLLVTCVFTLFVAALVSSKAKGVNMEPIWGFDKKAAMAANATTANINEFAHAGTAGILSAILATFAIAPWAYVGFDAIPQAAEEFNFSFKKVSFIMIIAIVFGCFVYVSNNTVAAAALENWPDRVMAGEWVVLVAATELLGSFGKILVGVGVSCAVLSGIMGFYLARRLSARVVRPCRPPLRHAPERHDLLRHRLALRPDPRARGARLVCGHERNRRFDRLLLHLRGDADHRQEERRRNILPQSHGDRGHRVQHDLHDPAADPDPGTERRPLRQGKLHHAAHLDRDRSGILCDAAQVLHRQGIKSLFHTPTA